MASCGFWARFAGAGGLVSCLLLGSCGQKEHPPLVGIAKPSERPMTDGGLSIDGTPTDGPPTCGGQTIPAVTDPPLLYFVIDRSGSMADPIDATGTTKFVAAQAAVGRVLDSIGHRVRYGAVLYPAATDPGSCVAGREVFPPALGDSLSAIPVGGRGPILRKFMNRLAAVPPGGATPTAATLAAVASQAEHLGERASIVLVTDGAPNCDADLTCPSSACIPDIERAALEGLICGTDLSCCDPAAVGAGAGGNCIDAEASEAAVKALADAGIHTYVIGMPGSEAYASLLERLARAGGTARPSAPSYYAVSALDALNDALLEIGTGLAIQCEIQLETPPQDHDLVNLYFDGKLLELEPDNGWDWTSEAALSVRGEACLTLRSGAVREVQIVYGCQTVVR